MFVPEKELVFAKCMDHRDLSFLPGKPESPRNRESHSAREILLVLKGECDFFLNGKYYPALPGSAFFVDHWIPHQQGYPADVGKIIHIWIHLHETRMFALPSIRGCGNPDPGCVVWEFPECMLELVRSRWDKVDSLPEKIRSDYFMSMARMLYEEICFQCYTQNPCSSREESIVSYVRNYIVMNHGRDSSMAELEKYTGYSRSHIAHLFREICGVSVGEYIQGVRCEYTVNALAFGMKQKEIASALGFSSPSAFWQWYRKFR
jgi:AraC-like DNA-binding protein